MSMLLRIIAIYSLIIVCYSYPTEDKVINLPDFNYNKSAMYSGYLQLDNPTDQLHYFFVESQANPSKDPLVLWLSGGPGCSSLYGMSGENGPSVFEEWGTKLVENEFSWNKETNVIYLESPAGVGFSNGNPFNHNDTKTANDNLTALLKFFKKFPEYQGRDFFITGESYAGIYIPHLANVIIDYNTKSTEATKINLKAILVGNGVTHPLYDLSNGLIEFGYHHGLYSIELKDKLDYYCGTTLPYKEKFPECKLIITEILRSIRNINIYDIYRNCYPPSTNFADLVKDLPDNVLDSINKFNKLKYPFTSFINQKLQENNLREPPCADAIGMLTYYNRVDVQAALHVTKRQFNICSDDVNGSYQWDPNYSYYLYPKIIQNKIRILKYSGDTDAAVPITGTRQWINKLVKEENLKILEAHRTWKADENGDISGHIIVYEGITFVSVLGTGHMVPQWKRREAFYMFSKFLKQEKL